MNHKLLADAVDFYHARGYLYLPDAPWTVGREAYYSTRPAGATDITWGGPSETPQYMVASGEQSFIQLMLDGRLLKKACCLTPCYRVEKYDDYRKSHFMKVELINADEPSMANLIMMVHDAMSFYSQFLTAKVIQTGLDSFDIIEKSSRTELGSYGIREHCQEVGSGARLIKWIFGTACAEPRLSTVLNRLR